MNNILLLTSFAAIIWGIGYTFMKKGFKNLSSWQTYAVDTILVAIPLWSLYGLSQGLEYKNFDITALLIALVTSIFWAVYYHTINIGPLSLSSALLSTYPVFSAVFAQIILQESITFLIFAGIILSTFGIILTSVEKFKAFRLGKWVYLSMIYALGMGLIAVLQKYAVNKSGNAMFMVFLALGQGIVTLLWKYKSKENLPKLRFSIIGYTVIGVIFVSIADIIYFYTLNLGLASIVVPLSQTYIVFIVIFSAIFLGEKIKFYQIAGIILVIAGVILINLKANTKTEFTTNTHVRESDESDIGKNYKAGREKVRVNFIYDGDTIQLTDRRKVRYIGINTPEIYTTKKSGECFGSVAAKINRELVSGQEIEMEKDVSEFDKYGRVLRYVWVDNVFVNEFLVSQGYAELDTIPPDTKYYSLFKVAEKEAKEFKRGLWGKCLR